MIKQGDYVKVNAEALEKHIKGASFDLDEGWVSTMRAFAQEGTIGEVVLALGNELVVNFCGTPCGGFGLKASIAEKIQQP